MKIKRHILGQDIEIELSPEEIKQIKKADQKITDLITGWESVAEMAGLHPVNDLPFPDPKNERQEATNSYFVLDVAVDQYNEGWIANFLDGNEPKWYAVWKANKSGFGFVTSYARYDDTYAVVGARLSLHTEALQIDCAKKFEKYYQKLLTKTKI